MAPILLKRLGVVLLRSAVLQVGLASIPDKMCPVALHSRLLSERGRA